MSPESAIRNPQSAIGNVLVSGIGYSNMSDMSFGRVLYARMAEMSWPPHVHVEDLNFGPVMIYQWLEEHPVKFDRLILVSAASRGREPGTLEVYAWDGKMPDEAGVQACVGEAVTGVISLENLLVVCKQFGVLPDEVTIIEIEPQNEEYGLEFSPAVAARIGDALEMVRSEAMRAGAR